MATHDEDGARAEQALLKTLLGLDFTTERLAENLAAFHDIRIEIEKLRQLDLTDVHPAILFEPTAPYRKDGGQ